MHFCSRHTLARPSGWRLSSLSVAVAAALSPGLAVADTSTELTPLVISGQSLSTQTLETWPRTADRPAADAGDWLRQQPGVDANRMGGHGLDPVIRGLGQNRLNILLDGAYVFGGCPNRMDPPTAYAPLHSYDLVTLSKGVTTLRYGPGGSGGTVVFERTRPELHAPITGDLGAYYASQGDAWSSFARVDLGGEQGYLRVFGEYSQADNYEDGAGREIWSGYETTQGGVILGWTPNQQTWLEFAYEETRERDVKFAGAGMDSPESDNRTLGLRGEYLWSPLLTLSGNLHYSQVEHVMDSFSLRPASTGNRVPTTSDTLTGRLMAEYQLGPNRFTGGVNVIQNERDATFYNPAGAAMFLMWPEVTQRTSGVFAEVEHLIGSNKRAAVGLRLDYAEASVDRAHRLPDNAGPMPPAMRQPAQIYQNAYGITGNLDREEWLTGAFVRFEQDIGDWQRAFISVSRSQRMGDATEMYLARPNWIGNPDLNPETSHQLDLGWLGQSQSFNYSAVVFANWVSDYIYRDQGAIGTYDNASHYRNIRAALYGIELEAALRYAEQWETRAQLHAMRGDNRSDGGALAQISPYSGQVSQHWISPQWEASATLRFAASQDRLNLAASEQPTAGYGVVDLSLLWRPVARVEVATGVSNLLDKNYANFINRNRAASDPLNVGEDAYTETLTEPGRSLWLSGRYRF